MLNCGSTGIRVLSVLQWYFPQGKHVEWRMLAIRPYRVDSAPSRSVVVWAANPWDAGDHPREDEVILLSHSSQIPRRLQRETPKLLHWLCPTYSNSQCNRHGYLFTTQSVHSWYAWSRTICSTHFSVKGMSLTIICYTKGMPGMYSAIHESGLSLLFEYNWNRFWCWS